MEKLTEEQLYLLCEEAEKQKQRIMYESDDDNKHKAVDWDWEMFVWEKNNIRKYK